MPARVQTTLLIRLRAGVLVTLLILGTAAAAAQDASPWLLVPLVASSPKLGTSGGVLGAYLKTFDPESRVSLFGGTYQYTSTESNVGGFFARTSFGADHHRTVTVVGLGHIKNDYDDYLGTGQPLRTNDDLRGVAGRYIYRVSGNWFVGGQGTAANYQVLGATPEDELALETLGIKPDQRMLANFEYAQGVEDNHGLYLKFGYAW